MERAKQNRLLVILFALFFALSALASPQATTYQARIVKPDGSALEGTNVNFRFTILNPANTCILYAENFSAINMANTGGVIAFTLGSGVKTYPASATTFAQVFNNATPNLSCDTGGPVSYSPLANDVRKIVMQFDDGAGWQTLPAMNINAVPYAIFASDSQSLGGVSATEYVRHSTIPTCTVSSQALQYNGSSFSCVTIAGGGGGGSGTVTAGDITTALGYTPADQSAVGTSFTSVTNSLNTVGTSFSTVTTTINSLGSSVTAVTNTVNTLSSSLTALTSVVNAHTSSLTALATSMTTLGSKWTANGSDIHFNSGRVGVGTSAPVTKFSVGDSLHTPSVVLANITSATAVEINNMNLAQSGQSSALVLNSVANPAANSTALDAGITADLRIASSQTANVGGRVAFVGLNTNTTSATVAEMHGSLSVLTNAGGGPVTAMAGHAGILQNSSGLVSLLMGQFYNVVNVASATTMVAANASVMNNGNTVYLKGTENTLSNNNRATEIKGFSTEITNAASADVIYGVHANILNTTTNVAKVQNVYGIYSSISNYSNASMTNVYGLYLNKAMTSEATNDYGIFQNDSAKNYFAGRIGIGVSQPVTSLEVSGGIRIGTLAATCAANYAGTLRYATGNVEYCNGTSWQAFGTGGAVTSSSVIAALSYTPANSATVATLTTGLASQATSITALTSSVNTHTTSLTNLTASMAAVVSSQWSTSGTNIYYNAGRVGIGTHSPRQNLDVAPATGNAIIRATSTNSTTALQLYRNTAGAYQGPVLWSNGTSLNFGHDTSENSGPTLMTLETNGNLGLGNTSPSFPLDISTGNAFAARYLHASNNPNDDAAFMLVRQRGTTTSGSAVQANDSIGGFYFRAHDGSNTNTTNAHVEVVAAENHTPSARGSYMTFATTVSGTTSRQEIMRLHSNGFVGIGNTSPNALLQVGPSGSQPANYNIYAASYRSTAGQGQYVGNWASSDYWALGPATNTTNKTLRLGIASDRTGTWSGTQDLNLTIGGKVGVGTSAPVGILEVNTPDATANLVLTRTGTPTRWNLRSSNNGVSDTLLISTSTNDRSGIAIEATGNIGVGTTTPASIFNIVASGSSEVFVDSYADAGNPALVGRRARGTVTSPQAVANNDLLLFVGGRGHDGSSFSTFSKATMQFRAAEAWSPTAQGAYIVFGTTPNGSSATVNRMFITESGSVGIGTATPTGHLSVAYTGQAATPIFYGRSSAASHATYIMLDNDTDREGHFGVGASAHSSPSIRDRIYMYSGSTSAVALVGNGKPVELYSSNMGTPDMIVNPTGHVGIGTTTPSQVNGWGKVLDVFGAPHAKIVATQAQSGVSVTAGIYSHGLVGNGYGGYLQGHGGVGFVGTETYHDLGIMTSNTTRIAITKAGDIGIGTTNPAATLHIASGTVRVTSNLNPISAYASGTNTTGVAVYTTSTTNQYAAWLYNNVQIGSISTATGTSVAYNTTSDRRMKENIVATDLGLADLLKVKVYNYSFKNDPSHEKQTGFIAQEVNQIFPNAVTKNGDDGEVAIKKGRYPWSMDYGRMTPLIVKALQDLYYQLVGVEDKAERAIASVETKADKAEVEALKAENAELKTRLERLEKLMLESQKSK